ncbi:Uncharacterised protein [Mycobacteroides abscessus subsp. abscessus]|nr:Uncharacterised protein [Mycobacteroides abscessus subsp. abscessus]
MCPRHGVHRQGDVLTVPVVPVRHERLPGDNGDPSGQQRGFLLTGLGAHRLSQMSFRSVNRLGGHKNCREVRELLSATLGASHRRRREWLLAGTYPGAEIRQIQGSERGGHRRDNRLAARRAAILVLLAVAHRSGGRHAGAPSPHSLNNLVAKSTPCRWAMIQVRRRQPPVPESHIQPISRLRNPEEHRIQVQHFVFVSELGELVEPPAIR